MGGRDSRRPPTLPSPRPRPRGFDEMGGNDDFSTEVMEAVLLKHGCLLEAFVS